MVAIDLHQDHVESLGRLLALQDNVYKKRLEVENAEEPTDIDFEGWLEEMRKAIECECRHDLKVSVDHSLMNMLTDDLTETLSLKVPKREIGNNMETITLISNGLNAHYKSKVNLAHLI